MKKSFGPSKSGKFDKASGSDRPLPKGAMMKASKPAKKK